MQKSEEGFRGNSAAALWKSLIQAVSSPMSFPNKQLTAYALFDGSRRDKAPGESSSKEANAALMLIHELPQSAGGPQKKCIKDLFDAFNKPQAVILLAVAHSIYLV